MKTNSILVLLFLFLQIGTLLGQCIADSGPNKVICVETFGSDTNQLGGNPTAFGGSPPYTYTWEAFYIYTIGTFTFYYTASDFLNDTTIANPTVVEWIDKEDWVEFHLTVTDANSITCRDTTSIRFSMYSVFLGYLNFNINQGDSIFLNHGINLSGGIPPYEFLWRPNHGLTDSTSLSFWAKPDYSIAYYVTVTDSAGCSIQGPNYYFINVIPVAIDEIEQNQIEIDVFPNPSQDLIFFNINREYLGEVVIEIFDNMSRLLILEKKSSNEFTIDVRCLKPGMYFYKVSNSKQLIDTGKLFVNR